MDKKILIIVIAIVAAIAIVGGYFLLNHQQDLDKTTLVLSDSAYMKVPLSKNATSKADRTGIFYYVDPTNKLNVTTYNSNLSNASGLAKMNKLKDTVQSGAKQSNEGDVVVYEKGGVYSIFIRNTETNDTILIQSTDKDILLACWQSIKYHDPSDSLKFEDTSSVVNATEQAETAVAEASSSASSSSSAPSTTTSDTTDSSTESASAYDDSSYSGSGSAYGGSSSGGSGGSAYSGSGSGGSGGSAYA